MWEQIGNRVVEKRVLKILAGLHMVLKAGGAREAREVLEVLLTFQLTTVV